MTGQEAHEALEGLNTKISELEQLLAEIRAGAALDTDESAAIYEELERALSEQRTSDLPRIIRRRLEPCGRLGKIGDCLRHAAYELEKWREEREPIRRELYEPYPSSQVSEEEIAASRDPGKRAA